jgi:hypothetical protein
MPWIQAVPLLLGLVLTGKWHVMVYAGVLTEVLVRPAVSARLPGRTFRWHPASGAVRGVKPKLELFLKGGFPAARCRRWAFDESA